jgi:hypothetical protein
MIDVRDRLVQTVSGDYYTLSSRIGDMRRIMSRDKVEEVLRRESGQRHDTVESNLFEIAKRSSEEDLRQLKEVLYLLAILDRLNMRMPQLPTIQQYIARHGSHSNISRVTIVTTYPNLLTIDDHDYIGLATSDVAAYLLGEFDESDVTQAISPQKREVQLKAIHQLLQATFAPSVLHTYGLDDKFFSAELEQASLPRFVIQRDAAMATLVIRLIGCLTNLRNQPNPHGDSENDIMAPTRAVIAKILVRLSLQNLDKEVAIELGLNLARLFFETGLLRFLLPVDVVKHTVATWGCDDQLFRAVYRMIKNSNALEDVESKARNYPWFPELQGMTEPGHLKIMISRMVATQWLQSRSFWTGDDVYFIFKWFGSVPEIDLWIWTSTKTAMIRRGLSDCSRPLI